MKIFSFKKKEKRSNNPIELPIFSDALLFSSFQQQQAMNLSAVYRAVEIISDSMALLPIQIKNRDTKHISIMENHPLNLVFKDGLGGISKYNFIKLLIQSVLLKGNGFAFIERANDGTVTGLRYLESGDVTIYYNKRKNELYYVSNVISNKKIEPCNMIHLVKNSYDGVNGISVLSYASRTLKLANNTENSASNFFSNGCNLSGVLTVQGQLSNQQRIDIKNSWNQAYNGNDGGIAVLQGNMSYQPIQLSASDSQMLESRNFNVSDIARFFGISPVLLGDLSHSSYSTIEATQNQFLIHTLQPYITMIEEEFSRKLFKPSENNLSVNLDETAVMKTDKTATANYYSTLLNSGVLCINEVRKELGYNEIDNGNKHIIAYTKIQDNTINNKEENKDKE